MCTETEFTQLLKNEQLYTLFHKGKELLERHTNQYLIKLFALNDFFVEIWFNSNQHIIEKIRLVKEEDLERLYKLEISLSKMIRD